MLFTADDARAIASEMKSPKIDSVVTGILCKIKEAALKGQFSTTVKISSISFSKADAGAIAMELRRSGYTVDIYYPTGFYFYTSFYISWLPVEQE